MAPLNYHPLDSSRHEIRLLRLYSARNKADPVIAGLTTVSLDSDPVFQALSYTWNHCMVTAPIQIDRQDFDIGPNLETALRNIRHHEEDRIFWIDAICINQKDEKERSNQVQLMRQIFSSARIVIAWLGEGDDESYNALSTLENLTHADIAEMAASKFKCQKWLGLKGLWGRAFWKRIWIVQEMALGDGRVVVQCGQKTVKRCALESAFQILKDHRNNPLTLLWEGLDCEMDWFMNQMEVCCAYDRSKDMPSRGQHLEDLIDFTGHFLASNARDHVYALLGLTEDGDRIAMEPNYSKTLPQICAQTVARLVHGKRSLKVLYGNRSVCVPGLSSWMPVFSNGPSTSTQVRRGYGWKGGFRACGSFTDSALEISACCTLLKVDGIMVDTVESVDVPFENLQSAFRDFPVLSNMKATAGRALAKQNITSTTAVNDAFLQTLVANAEFGNDITDDLTKLDIQLDQLLDQRTNIGFNNDSIEEVAPLMTAMVRTLRYRCFFTTASGYIGVGPYNTRVGDICAVLFGAEIPFLLRKESSEQRLVGDCYVHGIMQGELLNKESTSTNKKRFVIH
jgi:hypothetical protein